QHARRLQGFGRIEALHLGAINGWSRDDRKRHSLDLSVDPIDGLAGRYIVVINQGYVVSTDIAEPARGLEDEHLTRWNGPLRRADAAQWLEMVPHAAGAVGVLVSVTHLIARRLQHS